MTKFKTFNQDNNNPKSERTLVIIKPDGIQRSLIGEIISRLERTGLKLTAMKFTHPDMELAEKHYTVDPLWIEKTGEKKLAALTKLGKAPANADVIALGEGVLKGLQSFLSSGPVVCMVWQGMHAIGVVRKIVGSTEPLTSDVGTIRGDFTIHSYQIADMDGVAVKNLIHASSSPAEADAEINLWFKEGEVIEYKLFNEAILYS